jgi:tryptophan synthase alpha chain
MTNISDAFGNGKAFIPFITCGDPDLKTTEAIISALAEAGSDLIELGIPFSDPVAEGPVIQEANLRALSAGATTDKIFELVRNVRKTVKIPLVFMTYANVIFSYGAERFLKTTADIGVQGIIIPDIPFEERDEFLSICHRNGLALISMIAPTSHERIRLIASEAEGFLYCVSSLGVTGVRHEITTDVGTMIDSARKVTTIPCAVGFGISTPEQARSMAQYSDGIIVGSAIVGLCAAYGQECVPVIFDYAQTMKDALCPRTR